MAGTALASKEDVKTVQDLFNNKGVKEQIAMALPKHITADRLLRVAMTTVLKTPGLLKCDQRSLLSTVMECAQLGLMPDGILGQAYLVPFENRKAGRTDVTLIIGYKGLRELAYRSGMIKDWSPATIVYEGEPFKVFGGTEAHIEHEPLPPSKRGDKIVGVYSVAHLINGGTISAFMWIEEVEKVRRKVQEKNKMKDSGPWKDYYEEMVKKTADRRLAKYVPKSPDLQRVAALDEAREFGIHAPGVFPGDDVIDVASANVADKTHSKAQELTGKLEGAKANHRAPETDLDKARDKFDEGVKATGVDRSLFMQAAVYELKALEKDWTVADYEKALGLLNEVADQNLKIVTNKDQPMFEVVPVAV